MFLKVLIYLAAALIDDPTIHNLVLWVVYSLYFLSQCSFTLTCLFLMHFQFLTQKYSGLNECYPFR